VADALSGERPTAAADPAVVQMMHVLRNGDRQEFRRVLAANPKSMNAVGQSGWTPLMFAALYGDKDAVSLLLEQGANPNAQNDHGGTALMYAVDDLEKTRALVLRGANSNLRSGEGKTALQLAVGWPGPFRSRNSCWRMARIPRCGRRVDPASCNPLSEPVTPNFWKCCCPMTSRKSLFL
jgi:hypothetical protein